MQKLRIVVDNGHGGKDPGGSHNGQTEAKTNLNVANYLVEMLRADGHQVLLTNPKMQTMSINDRVRMSNMFSADITVSIHQNDFKLETAHGAEVCFKLTDQKSKVLAECVMAELGKINESRGIKPRTDLGMLKCKSTNILTEGAFMTSADIDEINTYEKQKVQAYAIYTGITNAIKKGLWS